MCSFIASCGFWTLLPGQFATFAGLFSGIRRLHLPSGFAGGRPSASPFAEHPAVSARQAVGATAQAACPSRRLRRVTILITENLKLPDKKVRWPTMRSLFEGDVTGNDGAVEKLETRGGSDAVLLGHTVTPEVGTRTKAP
ncbi:hypothetical protein GN956_G13445 [Arapaima gigas]